MANKSSALPDSIVILEAKTTLDVLREDYPGQAVVTTDQIARSLAKTGKAGAQTIRNQISSNTFPLADKLKKIGGTWVLPMAAFADWIDGKIEEAAPPAAPAAKRGRPRKAVSEWLAAFEASWRELLEADHKALFDDPTILGGTGELGDGRI